MLDWKLMKTKMFNRLEKLCVRLAIAGIKSNRGKIKEILFSYKTMFFLLIHITSS
jgi:hypothetical protein